jgi:peptidoglycan-N-acetylglucosamine deacetylase
MRRVQEGAVNIMRRAITIAVIAFAACSLKRASAEDQSLLKQCWTPQVLAGTNQELKSSRTPFHLDFPALKQVPPLPVTPVPQELRGSIRAVELPPGVKLIALTFDLCETSSDIAGYDGRIVDLLRAQDVKATFFAGGKWMETHRERAEQLIADPNFEIGGHGLRHLDLSHVSDQTLQDEIRLTETAYTETRRGLLTKQCAATAQPQSPIPEQMSVMRFPYGRCNAKSLAAVADAGLRSSVTSSPAIPTRTALQGPLPTRS